MNQNHAHALRVPLTTRRRALPPAAKPITGSRRQSEAVSCRERARVLCLQTLAGAPPSERSLLVRMEGPVGHLVLASGDQPIALWQIRPGADVGTCFSQARLDALRGSIKLIVTAGGDSARALAAALADYLAVTERRVGSCKW
ncbi:MAG TPA: hypothetical protein VFH73_06150 [Polyangia bacterium]|jgi:hypothetical protein|nr:hypothetical protein [Polyangia bacterium]